MPTVDRKGPYRFFFYSNEGDEPPHVHVERDRKTAKFWLETVVLESSSGFRAHELRKIERLVREKRQEFEEAWNGHFGTETGSSGPRGENR